MRFNSLALVSSFFLSGLLLACGGGGNTPPVTPLSITTTSLPAGQTAVAYSTTLAATGGTAPYSWSVKTGTLPAGLSLSTAGAIAGTPTTAGAANVTVQVSDSAMTPQTAASGSLTLAISGGTLKITTATAAVGTVGTAYNFQVEATGGVPPYTWAAATGPTLPAGLSLSSAGVVSGTPTAAGTFAPTIAVTDETTTNTTSEPVSFTINPAGAPLPDGNYAFQFNGNAAGGNAVAINGVFEVVKGAVGIGFYSENELNEAPTSSQSFTGGSASIATNGLGQLELSLQSGNVTFALAAPASALKSGSDSDIRIIEFDDTTGTGMRGSGVLKTANFNGALSAIKGGYAFAFSGWDMHSQPAALAGSFQADGLGNITSGTADMSDNGTLSSYPAVTGSYTTDPVGAGVITLKLSASLTVTYNYYQVTPTELLATSGDLSSSTIPLVSGLALQQTGPFTNASFTGVNVLELNGNAPQTAAFIPDITLGLLTSDGKGNVTATYDEYKASLLAPQTYTATYAVDAATGRTPITSGGTKAILYLVSNTKAFVLEADASTSSGLLEAQSGSPFTNTSLKGNYLGGTIPWPDLNVVSLVAADGAGNAQFTSDSSSSKGLQSNQVLSGTYSVDTHGRAVFTVSGDSTARIFYVVSPTRTVFLSGDGGGYLSSFEQ
jgi:hypothetical protein